MNRETGRPRLVRAVAALIARFNAVPGSIEVHIINRQGQPFLGSGETGQGPAAASIANAIANAPASGCAICR